MLVKKNWNSYHVFAKAVKSMEKFPLLLNSGKECAILDGVGPRICNIIDQKLVAHAKEMDCTISEALKNTNKELKEKKEMKEKQNSRPEPIKQENQKPCKRKSQSNSSKSPIKIPKTQSPREYRPKVGTGPHALLITLYENSLKIGVSDAAMSKEELIRLAQPRCPSSFTHADTAGSYYTAWSSMGTLVKKGFVHMTRNPATYSLTADGESLGRHLKSEETKDQNDNVESRSTPKKVLSSESCKVAPKVKGEIVYYVSASEDDDDQPISSWAVGKTDFSPTKVSANQDVSEPPQTSSEIGSRSKCGKAINVDSFFAHCLEQDAEIGETDAPPTKDEDLDSDEDEFLPLSARLGLVATGGPSKSKSRAESTRPHTASESEGARSSASGSAGFKFRYRSATGAEVVSRANAFRKEDAVDGDPGFLVICDIDQIAVSGVRYNLDLDSLGLLTDGQVLAYVHEADAPLRCEFARQVDVEIPKVSGKAEEEKVEVKPETKKVSAKVEKKVKSPVKMERPPTMKIEKKVKSPVNVERPEPVTAKSSVKPVETFAAEDEEMQQLEVLSAGDVSVKLVIDNREHYGMGRVKQLLLPALLRNDVPCDVRALPVGDFAWLVRKRGEDRSESEGVVDFIVERKRVDDLASSIKDGRMREQKARMKRCGFSRIIYLIEQFGGMKHTSLSPDVLMQALTNANVVDGCTLMFCRHVEDTVSYLTTMTRQLQRQVTNLDVCIVNRLPTSDERSQTSTMCCLEWTRFTNSAAKSQDLTVKELFAKQLLCFHGMAPERAEALLKVCPTPKSMLEKCSSITQKEWDEQFGKLKFGASKRNLGFALSKAICQFYSSL